MLKEMNLQWLYKPKEKELIESKLDKLKELPKSKVTELIPSYYLYCLEDSNLYSESELSKDDYLLLFRADESLQPIEFEEGDRDVFFVEDLAQNCLLLSSDFVSQKDMEDDRFLIIDQVVVIISRSHA